MSSTMSILLVSLLTLHSFVYAAPGFRPRAAGSKRGVSFQYDEGPLTHALDSVKSHFSWMYNWGCTHGDAINLPFVPMLHDSQQATVDGFNEHIDAVIQAGATHLFSVNEPDQCVGYGGACIQDVQTMVNFHKAHIQPLADKYPNLKISAPPVTNGEYSTNGTKMGANYLSEFLQKCTGCRIDFVVAHWYANAENTDYFKTHLGKIYDAGGKRKVWVTEFGTLNGGEEGFLQNVLPWLDDQDWIERYAYHYTHPGVLLTPDGKAMSDLGRVYATTT